MPLLEFDGIPQEDLVKGDAKAMCIAAASILAKVTRDRIMAEIDAKYPQYNIKKHKGYPTKEHMELLKKYGPIKGLYRYSYKPVKEASYEQTTLF
jgi:ribonuclease HII